MLLLVVAAAAVPSPARAAAVDWCGTPTDVDLARDDAPAFEWHVVYAYPRDGEDRFRELAPVIAGDQAAVAAWWTRHDPTRRPRYDLHDFAGCDSEFGQLDLSQVQLPRSAAEYARPATTFALLTADLASPPFRFSSPDKKYLVYYDGPIDNGKSCGESYTGVTGGGPRAYSVVFTQVCGQPEGEAWSRVAAHEMLHALGALPRGAPHPCIRDPLHVCDSTDDILAVGVFRLSLAHDVLDVGRDDYYGHAGRWLDAQDSPFLARLDSPDRAPPRGPSVYRAARGKFGAISFNWAAVTDDSGPVTYRIYNGDGELAGSTARPEFLALAEPGKLLEYTVRAADGVGLLGPALPMRFRVGWGVVDAAGRLLRDTEAPPAVSGVRFRLARERVVVRWRRVFDPGGLRGYRISSGAKWLGTVSSRRMTLSRRKFAGRVIEIRAVDLSGNVGPAAHARVPAR